jgi:hypothetical protein
MKAPLSSNGSSDIVLVDGLSESWQEIGDGFVVGLKLHTIMLPTSF